VEIANYRLNYSDISRLLPFLTNRGLWCRSTYSATGDDRRNQMVVHKGPASLRPRYTRSGSSIAMILVYQSTNQLYDYSTNGTPANHASGWSIDHHLKFITHPYEFCSNHITEQCDSFTHLSPLHSSLLPCWFWYYSNLYFPIHNNPDYRRIIKTVFRVNKQFVKSINMATENLHVPFQIHLNEQLILQLHSKKQMWKMSPLTCLKLHPYNWQLQCQICSFSSSHSLEPL
jgi:hypothetical protein